MKHCYLAIVQQLIIIINFNLSIIIKIITTAIPVYIWPVNSSLRPLAGVAKCLRPRENIKCVCYSAINEIDTYSTSYKFNVAGHSK